MVNSSSSPSWMPSRSTVSRRHFEEDCVFIVENCLGPEEHSSSRKAQAASKMASFWLPWAHKTHNLCSRLCLDLDPDAPDDPLSYPSPMTPMWWYVEWKSCHCPPSQTESPEERPAGMVISYRYRKTDCRQLGSLRSWSFLLLSSNSARQMFLRGSFLTCSVVVSTKL